jgi:hypothetical protein
LGGAYPFQPDVLAHQTDNVNRGFDLRLEIQFSNNSADRWAWLKELVSSTQILIKQPRCRAGQNLGSISGPLVSTAAS